MSRALAIVVVGVLALVILVGARQDDRELEFEGQLAQASTPAGNATPNLMGLAPPPGSIRVSDSVRTSHYQGIEVHLDALRWMGRWFRRGQDHGIDQFGGIQTFDLNKIIFDPDLPERGNPDLIVTASDVQFFQMDTFLRDAVGGYQLSKVLAQKVSPQGPYETYTWNVRDQAGEVSKQVKMELYLLHFSLVFQIQPALDSRAPAGMDLRTRHPITHERLGDLRPEDDNQRYSNLDVALKLVPRTNDWILAELNSNGQLVPNKSPRIGIAAVETMSVQFDGDPNLKERRIGAYIEKGQSLALHDSIDFGDQATPDKSRYLSDVAAQAAQFYRVKDQQDDVYLNTALFDREKYALVHVANFGSWRRGNIFSGKRRWADQITARFVVHAFVVGDWEIKRPELGPLQARTRVAVTTRSLVARMIPTFGLGDFGRGISGFLLLVGAVLVIGVLFPPVMTIINIVLKAIADLLKRILP